MRQDHYQRQLKARELITTQLGLCSNPNFEILQKEMMVYFTEQKQDIITLQKILTKQFEPYTRFPIKNKHLCTKELKIDPKEEKKKGYTCLKCRTQVNSIICHECFDREKHQDHLDKVKFVYYEPHVYSTCDCGDAAKWSQDGFCKIHQFVPYADYLKEEEKESFQEKLLYLFQVFYALYLLRLQTMNGDQHIQRQVDDQFNVFGICLMEKLVQCNKDRLQINKLTYQVVMDYISIEAKLNGQEQQIQVLEFLFSLTQQKNKDIITKCVSLFLLLVFRNQPFRQTLTIKYIQHYSKIVRTKYQDLSCYLLSNSLMMSELARTGRLGKFILNSKMESGKRENVSKEVQETIQAHKIYNNDIFFLTNLTEPCAVVYWNYFNDIDGFLEMANYSESFTNKQQFDIVNQEHYRVQYWFLTRLTKILDFVTNINDQKFLPKLIYKLFEKITKQYNQYQPQKNISNNLFFTYERFWALCVYLFLLRDDKNTFMPNKKQSKIQYNESLVKLYKLFNLPNIEQANKRFSFLLKKIINYVEITTLLSIKTRDEIKAQNKADFVVYYYGNDSFLFSIDSIFYQIVVKMMVYLQNKASRQQENNKIVPKYELGDNAQVNTKKTLIKHLYLDIEKILNERLYTFGRKILQNFSGGGEDKEHSNDQKKLAKALQVTKDFVSFISQITQMHYSQVPDLHIAVKFPRIRSRQYYKYKYMQYYHNLLASIKNNVIPRQSFIELVNRLLFEQYQVLKVFIDSTSKKSQTLFRYMSKGKIIDLRSHMPSLKRRTKHDTITQNYKVDQLMALPFLYETRNLSYQLLSTSAFNILKTILYYTFKKGLTIIQQKTLNWRLISCQMIRQMWKLCEFSGSQQIYKSFTNIPYFKPIITPQKEEGQQNQNQVIAIPQQVDQKNNQHKQKAKQNQSKQIINCFPLFFQQQLKRYLHKHQLVEKHDLQDHQEEGQYSHQKPGDYDEQIQMKIKQLQDKKAKEQSLQSSQQVSSTIVTQHICSVQKCPNGNKEDIHQLCFALYTLVPDFFSLEPKMNVIYFTSCQHYFHKTCLKKIKCYPQEGNQYKCPKCQSKFNFLLISKKQLDNPEENYAIIKMFETICKAIFSKESVKSSQVDNFYHQILKSFIVYILIASTMSIVLFDKINLELMTQLLKILQRYLQKKQKGYDQNQIDIFKFVEEQKTKRLLNYLKQVVSSKIGYGKFGDQKIKYAYISKEQAQVMDIILQKTFLSLQQNHSFSDKTYLGHVQQLAKQRINFKCLYPPKDLFELSQIKGECYCGTQSQKYNMISLLQKKIKEANYSCVVCENKFIMKHIKNHKNELLAINIDTGFITYYAFIEKKYWTLPLGYVYKDSTLRVFSEQLGIQYFQNIQNKRLFELIPIQYERILFEFHSKVYFATGKLKEISIS